MRRTSLLYFLAPLIGAVLGIYALGPVLDDEPSAASVTTTDEAATGPVAGDVSAKPEPPAVPVMVLPSEARETSATLILRGRTTAVRNVQVPAETTGLVVSEPLRRGSEVEAGQLLCRLSAGVRAAQLAEAEASLTEARAEASAAKQLQKKGFAAETTLNARDAQLRAAQARVDQVAWDIGKLEIRSPFAGVLESDTAEIGSLLAPGGVCANVIDLSRVKVTAFVAEQDVDLLRVGQTAAARLINGTTATGEISFISRVADEQTRTYSVDVIMDNPDARIRDGMTAELAISLPPRQAHLIPQTALTLDDQGQMGVRLDVDGIARFRPVQILRDVTEGAWVAGLNPTARIIVVGQEFVRDGRTIVPTEITIEDLR